LLEIFCVYTEISVTNIGVLAAFPASFCLLFLQGSVIFQGTSCIQHLGGFPSTLLDLGDISPLFSFISLEISEVFLSSFELIKVT
jgi:hypothetical protein